MDVTATLLAAGGAVPPTRLEGIDLLPMLEARPRRAHALLPQHAGGRQQRAVREAAGLLVDGPTFVFDSRDVGERNDLASSRTDIARTFRRCSRRGERTWTTRRGHAWPFAGAAGRARTSGWIEELIGAAAAATLRTTSGPWAAVPASGECDGCLQPRWRQIDGPRTSGGAPTHAAPELQDRRWRRLPCIDRDRRARRRCRGIHRPDTGRRRGDCR
jgi:hypothetical protein